MKKRPTPKRGSSPAIQPGYRKGLPPANKGQVYPPSVMNDEDVLTLILGCSRTSATGLRDRALIALLYRSGLRISEALALQISDLRKDESMVLVRRGKGNKTRLSAMDEFGWKYLDVWLKRRATIVPPYQGWVFCTVSQPVRGGRLGSPQVRMMLKRKAEQAGLEKRVHPHAFRHGHAFGMAKENVPIPIISKQLGHGNVGTTSTYLSHVDPSLLVDAITSRPQPGAEREEPEAPTTPLAPVRYGRSVPGGPVLPNQASWQEQAKAAGWQQIEIPADDVESEAA